jgi:hydrogenase maturation protease
LKTLVLGLGNPILTDDGVGIHVVRQVAAACSRPDVAFAEAAVGGLRLLELIAGYDRLILVDAIQTPDGRPGQIHRLTLGDLRTPRHAGSTHDLSFREAIAWGRRLGLALPADEAIAIVAIEAEDVLSFGESLTPAVAAAVAPAAQMVLDLLVA